MQYVCDAGAATWFRIETELEAVQESLMMGHAVERYFRDAVEKAAKSYAPPSDARLSEQNIGLKAHIKRSMPIFLTLRNRDGGGMITAMLPPVGQGPDQYRPILVGPNNSDPYRDYPMAINILAQHFKVELDPARCYPYRRT
jgi:hypothetical protein